MSVNVAPFNAARIPEGEWLCAKLKICRQTKGYKATVTIFQPLDPKKVEGDPGESSDVRVCSGSTEDGN